jgi:predicted metal-dependent hydrolase
MLRRLLRLIDPPDEERIEVRHLDRVYPVVIRASAIAKRYTLKVKPSSREAILSMPLYGSKAAARDFATRHGGWLAARFAKLPEIIAFEDGAILPVRGVLHKVESRPAARGTVKIEPAPDMPVLAVSGQPEFLARRLKDFLKREARRDIELAARRHAANLGVSIKRIAIKDTTSRWGSCAADGSLSFSWRMILAPPLVLDYLAAHEIAHRVEMNHSSRYWKVVESIFPDYEKAEAWLKRHGTELHRYG